MCDCVKQMDEKLAEYNAAIVTPIFGPPTVCIETYKVVDRRTKKPPKVMATYCPFCGTKYERSSGTPDRP